MRSHEYFNDCACRLFVETPRGRRVFTGRLFGHLESVITPGKPLSRRAEMIEMVVRYVDEVPSPNPTPTKDAP